MNPSKAKSIKAYDVVVIGAGIIGMATAHYLCKKGIKLAVVERSYMGSGSTGRCIGGIRQQFSTPSSIRLMQENMKLFSEMQDEFACSVEFHQGGYLLLAYNEELVDVFKNNIEIQQKENVNVSFLTPGEAQKVVPSLNTDGLLAAAYCPDDAQAFPFPILRGYKKKIEQSKKGEFFFDNPVKTIEKKENFQLALEDGTYLEAEKVLLSAGPWTGELAKQMGLELPLYPERHEVLITQRIPRFFDPMIVDYRPDGCYFHQLTTGQIIGCYSPIPKVPGIIEEASFEFLPQLSRRMTRLIPELGKAGVLRQWAGCYTMTPDGNPIVDESEIKGLYIASGMSGHGFMLGPAMGLHLADYMVSGKWRVDFSEFAINRIFKGKEKLK